MKNNINLKVTLGIIGFALMGFSATAVYAADGAKIYKDVCASCHDKGVMGAPKLGVKDDWKDRLGQGVAVLEEHAIKGFKGKKGMMPPKGGRMNLSDADVKAAVAFMLGKVK